ARVVWVTHRALALGATDPAPDPAAAAIWGLGRTAQLEEPERRLVLVDLDELDSTGDADRDVLVRGRLRGEPQLALDGAGDAGHDAVVRRLPAGLTALVRRLPADEPQLAIRRGAVHAVRLHEAVAGVAMSALPPGAWRLDTRMTGRLDSVGIVRAPDAEAALPAGHVRLAVRAGGLNFRDVMTALGIYPGTPAPLGGEGSGVVVERAADVAHLAVGDRVFGLLPGSFASAVVADARLVRRMPARLSFAEAATIPIAFMTALWGLDELAGLRRGERLLVHAAAGGVGLAALQLARLRGAEVYATASPSKWPLVRAHGVAAERIASSRDASFEPAIRAATGGAGVDVVLDSLAGELVDASLRLMPRGGRFIEIGKTDLRDVGEVARAHPGVAYRAFDLIDAGPERLAAMLAALAGMLERREIDPLPLHAFDVRDGQDAFRWMAKGWHTGKLVLVPPRALAPDGTVVVTGWAGGVGGVTVRHLVRTHGVKHLLLLSRSGADGPGPAALVEELRALGAETVTVRACDVADRAAVVAALASVPAERPVTGVFHSAVVLDDGLLGDLTAERVRAVLRPKVEAAWHLDELTRGMELAAFVMFSSVTGTFGNAAQGSYAAANAALDALAVQRQRAGLAGKSVAWGSWAQVGQAANLDAALQRRLRRTGVVPLEQDEGMQLLDEALERAQPVVMALKLDRAALVRAASEEMVGLPALLAQLVRPAQRARRADDAGRPTSSQLAQRLARLPDAARAAAVMSAVRTELAAVLGLPGPDAVPVDRPLKELGLDSLMAVEARNRLSAAIGHKLPASLLFDYPTPTALAGFLRKAIAPARDQPAELLAALETLERYGADAIERSGVLARLARLAGRPSAAAAASSVAEVSDDDLLKLIDDQLGAPP
ncbi:MAG TPA: SDR family NAD(P)-dependent oxidoreductase, partial [Kofleriaceae bacterium]|nr:SDR family NAD(P)-dependent oxidoreductase [Kofleriaceae bacterium]